MKLLIRKEGFWRQFTLSSCLMILTNLLPFSLSAQTKILNASFDPTRELFDSVNRVFVAEYQKTNKEQIQIQQSHGGSGKQARAVIDGLEADVVTLALSYDIDSIAEKSELVDPKWETQFPNKSVPYFSTIVFLVRRGNPKQIKDWEDLVKKDTSIITPNPKTSGGARWNYLAAFGYAKRKFKSETKAVEFVKQIYENTSVLDAGARASTTTFVKRGIGDVLITWENEAELAIQESKKNGKVDFEIIYPKESIKADTPVAIVSGVTKKRGTDKIAKAYLDFLFTKEGQKIIAKHYFRPIDKEIMNLSISSFPKIELFTIEEIEGNWKQAHKKHFSQGGIFDSFYSK